MNSRSGSWATWLLIPILAMALAGCEACGGGDDVNTDPAGMDGANDLPTETVPDPGQDFGGDPIGNAGGDGSDMDDDAAMVELGDIFFDFDKSELSAAARAGLADNGTLLRDNADARILIEGHCDERGTVQYNLALGEKRAQQAKDYLVSLGVDARRIDVVSYGKERPFQSGHNEAAWSQNRRAHFVIR